MAVNNVVRTSPSVHIRFRCNSCTILACAIVIQSYHMLPSVFCFRTIVTTTTFACFVLVQLCFYYRTQLRRTKSDHIALYYDLYNSSALWTLSKSKRRVNLYYNLPCQKIYTYSSNALAPLRREQSIAVLEQ